LITSKNYYIERLLHGGNTGGNTRVPEDYRQDMFFGGEPKCFTIKIDLEGSAICMKYFLYNHIWGKGASAPANPPLPCQCYRVTHFFEYCSYNYINSFTTYEENPAGK